jgi:hypothetical protein
MRNSRYVDGFGCVIDLVYDPVSADANPPFAIAASEFFATWRPWNHRQTLKTRHHARHHLCG